MPAYYSLLQALLRPETNEVLVIGLLLAGEGQVFFAVSDEKTKAAKSLLSPPAARLLMESLRDIERSLAPREASGLLPSEWPLSSEAYLGYSARYHHNLLRFTAPERISIQAGPASFRHMFTAMVHDAGPSAARVSEEVSPFRPLQERLYPQIRGRVNLDVELTSREVPHLFLPAKVNFIGKNEVPVIGKEILFSKRSYNLGNDLKEVYALSKAFDGEQHGAPKVFLLGDEPSRSMSRQHQLWTDMRNSPFVEVVPVAESDRVSNYMEVHGVMPFLEP